MPADPEIPCRQPVGRLRTDIRLPIPPDLGDTSKDGVSAQLGG